MSITKIFIQTLDKIQKKYGINTQKGISDP